MSDTTQTKDAHPKLHSERISEEVMEIAASIERDIPSRVTGESRVFIRAVIARAIQDALAAERDGIASYIEGRSGGIPAASVFAPLVSKNNMPDMSGDPRARLSKTQRRDFDDATERLASSIRARSQGQRG